MSRPPSWSDRLHRAPQKHESDAEEIATTIRNNFLKHVHLVIQVSPDVWSVFGDPTEAYQVLLNLAVNARDAMPKGGTLGISVTNVRLDEDHVFLNGKAAPGAYVRFAVSDTGSGIAPEISEKIFDPFFTTKEVAKGTGLGLSTALGIVKSYRGFMNLTSEVGRGSTFEFYLPADFSASVAILEIQCHAKSEHDGVISERNRKWCMPCAKHLTARKGSTP
jgi:two-component system cell cycle sensor histidine kinase/response regulator CckA